jgi:hypothetical protein
MPGLLDVVTPLDESRLVLCHRDLHPENLLADTSGAAVVVDWDNLGPADPSRELAHLLFDWWCDPSVDAPAMRAMYEAYVGAGGPGRVREPGDFTMLVSVRLNFLLVQLTALARGQDVAWAEREIDESLRILPTAGQLAEVLTLFT